MNRTTTRSLALLAVIGIAATWLGTTVANAEDKQKKDAGAFSSLTIDLGVVVGDIEKSAKFYTEVIGFQQVGGFHVPGSMGKGAGLSDNLPLDIRVFSLGKDKAATKLKLMQVAGTKAKKSDQAYIHSTLGFSYLTIFVNDTNAAVKRLDKAGVKILAEGPYELPKGFPEGIFLTVVRDPDGNFVELVGPKK